MHAAELQYENPYVSRRTTRELEDDNVLLVRKNSELKMEVQKLKANKKKMQKKHRELVMVLVGINCVVFSFCVALIIKGIV